MTTFNVPRSGPMTVILVSAAGCLGPELNPTSTERFAISSFEASEEMVEEGTRVVLSWKITGADSFTIQTREGSNVLRQSKMFDATLRSRALVADTTFVLTATKRNSELKENVTVRVRGQPKPAQINAFTGPRTAAPNSTIYLSWNIVNATEGRIVGGDRTYPIDTEFLGTGELQIEMRENTVFTMFAKGSDGQENQRTHLVEIGDATQPAGNTASELFNTSVVGILQAKCGACHSGTGNPVLFFLGANRDAYYETLTQNPTYMTALPENNLLLVKGEHAGPAFCSPTNSMRADSLNNGCTPTTEADTITRWLIKEAEERGLNNNTDPPGTDAGVPNGGGDAGVGTETDGGLEDETTTPPTTDYTPRTLTEALNRFSSCMQLTDWAATYGQSQQTQTALQNTQQGNCAACHAGGLGGAYLNTNSDQTFTNNRQATYIQKLVRGAPATAGAFNPDLLPANRFRDHGADNGTHPRYTLGANRQAALDEFLNRTLTRYRDFTQACQTGP